MLVVLGRLGVHVDDLAPHAVHEAADVVRVQAVAARPRKEVVVRALKRDFVKRGVCVLAVFSSAGKEKKRRKKGLAKVLLEMELGDGDVLVEGADVILSLRSDAGNGDGANVVGAVRPASSVLCGLARCSDQGCCLQEILERHAFIVQLDGLSLAPRGLARSAPRIGRRPDDAVVLLREDARHRRAPLRARCGRPRPWPGS